MSSRRKSTAPQRLLMRCRDSAILTLMIGSMTNRATANRCCFHTTKHSYDRLDGWCELSQIPRRMHMGFEHHRSGTHILHGHGNCRQHQNLIGHPAPVPRRSHGEPHPTTTNFRWNSDLSSLTCAQHVSKLDLKRMSRHPY